MRIFILIPVFLFISCSQAIENEEVKENRSTIRLDCKIDKDSLFFAMAPIKDEISDASFVDLRAGATFFEKDSLVIEVITRGIPDSIIFNNSKINKGYSEFGLDVAYRHRNYSGKYNLVFSLYYNNFGKPVGEIKDSFNGFINACEFEIYLEKEDTVGNNDVRKLNTKKVISNESANITLNERAIIIKIHKDTICPYLNDYFHDDFYVKICYNNAKVKSENNYISSSMSSDSLLIHSFIWDTSRKLD